MANKRFIDFPIATTVGDNDIILIWQGGANKQTTKATILSGVPDSLNDLTDVTISGLTNGQILRYDSVTGQWENTDQGNLDLNDLNDVTIVSPTNGQVLVYNSSTSKWENSSGGYVPYVGAVTTVDLGLQGLEAGYVRFDTSIVSVPDEQGLMYWDASRSTVALIMNGTLQHIGQDTFFYVKNSTGSSIPKGTCVRFAGTDGASGHLLITPFLANGSVPSTYFLGVTAETITNGSFGQVMHFGELEGINTSSYTAGALLYASTTVAGAFQTTAPVAPNNIVLVAAAVNSKNNGAIVVRPTYGSNINNDEGVKITSPTTGDLLQLQAGGLWENKTIDAAGIVTKATNQTITGIKTFSQDIIVNGVNVGRGGGTITSNTIVGEYALNANTTGNSNTAIGQASMVSNTTGASNTAVGRGALEKNTTAIWNCGIGTFSLFGNTTGSSNIAVGNGAGGFIADGITENSITNNSVFLGGNTKALANNQTNQIVIGHNAIGEGSNTVVIGNSSILSNRFFGTMRIGTINNGVGDFITTDANGVLTKRTGAEVRTDIGAGTVTSVAALTLGTSGTDLSSTVANGTTTPVITLNVPTASATNRGALSAADWTTFNNKQNALTNPVTGTGTSGQVAYFNGTTSITSESNLFWDATNDSLGIGTNSITNGTTFGGGGQVNRLKVQSSNYTALEINGSTSGGSIQFTYGTNLPNQVSGLIGYNYANGAVNEFSISNVLSGPMVFATTNVEAMRIFAGRNIHIGPTPASDNGARLQVSGTSTFSDTVTFNGSNNVIRSGNELRFNRTDNLIYTRLYDAGSTFALDNRNGNGFSFQSAGTNQFVISSTGAATFSSSVTASGGFEIPNGQFYRARRTSGNLLTDMIGIPSGTNDVRIVTTGAFSVISGGLASFLHITDSGNVGIMTPSPSSLFSLVKSSNSGSGSAFPRIDLANTLATQGDGSSTFNFSDIRISSGNSAVQLFLGTSFAQGTWEPQGLINMASNYPLVFRTNNTERMRITSAGKGLFGTQTPSAGASGFAANSFQVKDEIVSIGSGAGFFWENRSGGVTASSNWYGWYTTGGVIYLYNGASNIASINSSTGAYTALSDINKKENFETSEIGLKEVLNLKPTIYSIKDDTKKERHLGFIAQEVKQYIPQAYIENDEFIGLNEMPIIAALTKAIQELKQEIDTLKN